MSKPTTGLRRAGIASFATGALALSACVVGAGAANADADFAFERIAGDNRYETAAEVYDAYGDNDSVILANGEQGHFPDALVANYLAGVEGSPILLTRSNKMPDATAQRLDGGGKTITIVGGEDVVPAEQAAALEAEGHTVERVAGPNRYLTAAEVIEEAGDSPSNTAIITTGVDFPDALAAGPVSVHEGSPIAISRANDIRDEEVDALVASGVTEFIVLGGPTIVGPAVVAELEAAGLDLRDRIAGADRAETSADLANYAIENFGLSDEGVNVASGYIAGTGADALAGGPLTGEQVRPMLITKSNRNAGDGVLAFLEEHANTLSEGIIFGGLGAIDQATEDEMEAAARSVTSNQDFTASPADNQSVEEGSVVQFNFSGIDSDTVDIALYDCSNVSTDENGQTTFSGTNPGGTGNVAQEDGTVTSEITVVNGQVADAGDGASREDEVDSADGSVSFSVDTTGAEGECFVAVVFDDADNDDNLDLGADGQPSEAFGTSGDVNVLFPESGDNTSPVGEVTGVDKDANLFVVNSLTFYYDANDEFVLDGTTDTPISMDEFEQRLTVGDNITDGNYRSDAADQSSFTLNDDDPAAPTVNATQNTADGGVTVEIAQGGSADDAVDSYNVYRAVAADQVTPLPDSCDPADVPASAYTLLASVDNDPADDTESYDDTTAAEGTSYCYTASAVEGTDEGPRSAPDGPIEGAAATPASAPEFTDAAVVAGTSVVTVTYDEPVQCDTVDADASNYAVTLIGSSSNTGLTEDSAECVSPSLATDPVDNEVEITVTGHTFAAGETVRVDANNGADGNTVLDADGDAQPADDAVQTTTPDTTNPTVTNAAASESAPNTVSGSVDADDNVGVDSVTVTLDDGTNPVTTVQATDTDGDGTWTFSEAGVANGTYTVTFTAEDAAGNTASTAVNGVVVDGV